ncbi:glutamine amidotransferase [Fulvimarina manganoxydans]|uniref:Glutamine amidotransferase n=1 Tax=Fulvimarina manganoxydans TaxID=937218 RepID=A0A1W2BFW2_9HYPH|nr:class II glutamine amidotransferase [Fulvimarina manganoxydans]SMC71809.1 glutamine amidotransferase [Fulvimarina manganoxydans]
MCRLFAYSGEPVWLDTLLIEPEASLVSQSMAAREAKTVVNGDGCGLGWYGERERPGLYRDTLPAWSDANLAGLCHQIRSGAFMAHVRSATAGEVSRANCHPFALGRHLFMHNGQIGGYDRLRRRIDSLIPDEFYGHRHGTGDSEAIFLIAAGQGLETDPVWAIDRALRLCLSAMTDMGIADPLRFSAVLMDGETTHAFRWSSDARPPTLYWRALEGGIAFSSEPCSLDASLWTPLAPNSFVRLDSSSMIASRFDPASQNPCETVSGIASEATRSAA